MSNYVISDIHGCYGAFLRMLEKIQFSGADTMYILGDVLDRGPYALELADYIISKENIIWIKGNHEELFEDAFVTGDYSMWYQSGGAPTYEQMVDRGRAYEEYLYTHISKLPAYVVVGEYILVHAGLNFMDGYERLSLSDFLDQDQSVLLWGGKFHFNEGKFKTYTVIHGHTPVQRMGSVHGEVIKRDGFISIDCGYVFGDKTSKLACVRLDDLKEFYITRN